MKNTKLLHITLACLLVACEQPAAKKTDTSTSRSTQPITVASTIQNGEPTAQADNTTSTATKDGTTTTVAKPSSNSVPSQNNKIGTSQKDNVAVPSTVPDNNAPLPGNKAASPQATPPVFKTAAEAQSYLESILPYDIADSSFRSVRLEQNTFAFTAVIKGVEDATAFQASHDMTALQAAYHKGSLPYLCAQEPLATLWAKKKIRTIHLDYQDEHGNTIMQYDVNAADCAAASAPEEPSVSKSAN